MWDSQRQQNLPPTAPCLLSHGMYQNQQPCLASSVIEDSCFKLLPSRFSTFELCPMQTDRNLHCPHFTTHLTVQLNGHLCAHTHHHLRLRYGSAYDTLRGNCPEQPQIMIKHGIQTTCSTTNLPGLSTQQTFLMASYLSFLFVVSTQTI